MATFRGISCLEIGRWFFGSSLFLVVGFSFDVVVHGNILLMLLFLM